MQAVILSVNSTGAGNSLVNMLTRGNGVCGSLLYGGPKSKLRSLVQPFNSGIIWLYEDKTKDSSKIKDFEVTDFHAKLKSSLYKLLAASLAAELVIRTHAAGEPEGAFVLLSAFLDGTDASDEDAARLGTIRFLWRYLALLGVQPPVEECRQKFKLSSEAASYLDAINRLAPGEVRRLSLQAPSLLQLKGMIFPLIEEASSGRLKTLETGFSIL